MQLVGVQRRRSRTWGGVFLFALLTMSSYVVFDILDLDGSQMTGWPGDDFFVEETLQINSDRFFHGDPSAPGLPGLIHRSLAWYTPTETRGLSPARTILRVRHSRMLPRVDLSRDMARASFPSPDSA